MNLHGIVSGVIGAVNPPQLATILQSTGYTTNPDGTRIPTYAPRRYCWVQVQELASKDLQLVEGLDIQGETKAIYLNGDWSGIVRPDGRGGDLINVAGRTWLVVQVAENWPDWTKVVATLQMPA